MRRGGVDYFSTFVLGAPKRAAWDYKGRMEDLEQYIASMKGMQRDNRNRIEFLESQKDQLQGNVVIKEKEKEEVQIILVIGLVYTMTKE